MYYDSHPSLDALELLLLNRLSGDESTYVETHLSACHQCRSMADELMHLIEMIQATLTIDCDRQSLPVN